MGKKPRMSLIEFLMSEAVRGKLIMLFAGVAIAAVGSFFANSSKTVAMIVMLIGCAVTVAAVEQINKIMPRD